MKPSLANEIRLQESFDASLREHIEAIALVADQIGTLYNIVKMISNCLRNGGKVLLCGNGGSAADCQHIAAELTGRFLLNRRAIPALALTTDTSALTAIANDFDFDSVFSRQVEALGQESDCLIAISTSGNSRNVIKAVETARKMKINTVGLLGNSGGQIKQIVDFSIVVSSNSTARIQEVHIFVGHLICQYLEEVVSAQ